MVLVYTTAENENGAKRMGRTLIEKKLAACVNIIPGMKSIYRWKGKIEKGDECIMLVKTLERNVNRITEVIKDMHSYELPCILVIPIIDGLKEYLDYIRSETCRY